MNARTYLSQYMVLNHRIEGKMAILNDLKATAEKTSFAMSDVVVSRSRNYHAMEDVIIRIQELKDQITRDMLQLLDLRDELMKQIEKVPDCRGSVDAPPGDCRGSLRGSCRSGGAAARAARSPADH